MASEQRDGRAGPRRPDRAVVDGAGAVEPGGQGVAGARLVPDQPGRGAERPHRRAGVAVRRRRARSSRPGPRPATTVSGSAAVASSCTRAAPKAASGSGSSGGPLRPRGARSSERAPTAVVGQHVAAVPAPRPRRAGGPPRSRQPATRSRPPPPKASTGSPMSLSWSLSTPSSTSRPARAGRRRRAARPHRGRGWWGRRRRPWCAASGSAASSASIDRTTSTSTPCWRSTSASALAPSGRCPRGRGRRWVAARRGPAAPRAAGRARRPRRRCRCGAPGRRSQRRADRGGAAVLGRGRSSRACRGGRVRQHRPGAGEVGVQRDEVTGRLRAGGAAAVAHGVERVGRDGQGRRGCREHRPQRDRHLVGGATGEVDRAGCARSPTG